jgi:methionine-rich copper-binding protein CopC
MRSRRSWPLFVGLFIGLLLALASANAAQAATLVSSSPAAGARISTALTQVTVTADSALAEMGSSLTVTGPDGTRVDDGSVQPNGATALVGVKTLTAVGDYKVTYQLILANGQNLSGAYAFTFSPSSTTPSDTPTPSPAQTLPALDHSSFVDRLKGGGIGLLLVALVLIVVGSRVASSRRNRN